MKIIRSVFVLAAAIFGFVTIIVGTRVLLGSDPGFIVFRPLLVYNIAMGFVYVAAAIIAWRSLKQGMYVAAGIFILNLLVLTTIYFLYTKGSSIAVDSLRAMCLRTAVWLALFAGFGWLNRRSKLYSLKPDA